MYFKELEVWQQSMALAKAVYTLLAEFPEKERFCLTDQLARAVVSIPPNIAEGNGRTSPQDYAHFLSIARGSLYETETQLLLAADLGYIAISDELTAQITTIGKMLSAMINRQKSR